MGHLATYQPVFNSPAPVVNGVVLVKVVVARGGEGK
jgi:hypothetical protein